MSKPIFSLLVLLLLMSCKKPDEKPSKYIWQRLDVKATAYNSVTWQTDGNPSLGAFGDTLRPGMKCIAVSRDLLRMGLGHNTPVRIEGQEGIYLVKDKLHPRKYRQIDIYMGLDVQAARDWGRQKICIDYGTLREEYQTAK